MEKKYWQIANIGDEIMNGDIIKCLNPYCNMEFKDTTKLKMQDSRKGQFINRCPYCLGVNTINTNESAVKKTKFIYRGISTHGGTKHTKSTKHVKKVDLDTEHIATKILGIRKGCNVKEELNDFPSGRTLPMGEPIKNEGYFQKAWSNYCKCGTNKTIHAPRINATKDK